MLVYQSSDTYHQTAHCHLKTYNSFRITGLQKYKVEQQLLGLSVHHQSIPHMPLGLYQVTILIIINIL